MHRTFFLSMICASIIHAESPLREDAWELDVVHRSQGAAPLRGLVQAQDEQFVYLKLVIQKRGLPTVVMSYRIPRKNVIKVELLPPEKRKTLLQRLKKLADERKILAAQLKLMKQGKVTLPPGEQVTLKPTAWGKEGPTKALLYESTQFRLISNAREDIVQLTAIRLEQIFSAFQRHLPPRAKNPKQVTIRLSRSLEDYYRLVRGQGRMILNPAFYDPQRKEVMCGSDLERLGRALADARKAHQRMRAQIKQREDQLNKIYNRRVPEELKRPFVLARKRVQFAETRNESVFEKAVKKLYQRLYHEAFHAYLDSAVLSERMPVIPLWLNEGLAQIFETAIVTAGELRAGSVDDKRLARLRDSLKKKSMLPLSKLITASPRQFQVAHVGEQARSDQYYLTSWALAYYLTFHVQVVGTDALAEHARNLKNGVKPVQALERLVKKSLPELEKDLHEYLRRLRQDGTVAPSRKKKS